MSKSPWLELFEAPQDRGLGLRVTRDCPAGAALLTEKPLAAVLGVDGGRNSEHRRRRRRRRRRRCRRCLSLLSLRKPSLLRACRRCCNNEFDPCYCDSDCEEEDRDAHVLSGECELLRRAALRGEERGGEGTRQETEAEEVTTTTASPPPPPQPPLPFLREACLALRLLRARPPSAGPLVTHDEELLLLPAAAAASSDRASELGAAAELASRALEATLEARARAKEDDADDGDDDKDDSSSSSSSAAPPPPTPIPFETILRAVSAALCAAVVNSVELDFCDEDKEEQESDDDDDDDGDDDNSRDVETTTRSETSPLALYAFACRANHSCRPTASFSTRSKGKISLRALRAMKKGEEVTINYVRGETGSGKSGGGGGGRRRKRPFVPLAERRRFLEEVHGFRCECERCMLDEKEEEEEEEETKKKREGGGRGDDEEMEEENRKEDQNSASSSSAAATFLRCLSACLEAERLLSRGETAAIEVGGRAWAEAAEALVRASGEESQRTTASAEQREQRRQMSSTSAVFSPSSSPATSGSASFAGPPRPLGLFSAVFSAAEACSVSDPRAFGSLLRSFSGVRDTSTTTERQRKREEEEEEEQAKALLRRAVEATNAPSSSSDVVFSLALAASHASARSASLLGAALGRAHPLAERARFSAFGGGEASRRGGGRGGGEGGGEGARAFPFDVAAQVVRLASYLERTM